MVVLLSPSSASSQWVQFEVGAAEGLKKPIVPVLLPGSTFEESVPDHLRDFQILDGNKVSVRDIAKRIAATASSSDMTE